jgi:acetylornithine deacetylase/succinyl-diaminopimelate desuccinylase-like protein
VGDRLYGLGATDMKAGVVAIMLATRALAERRDLWNGTVIFSSCPDEENLSAGALGLVADGIQADACIVTESNFERPIIGGVGKMLVRLDVTGKAAHGAWPAAGINAAVEGARLLAQVDDLPLGEHPRMTATQCVLSFHSGSEQYVITVPEKARALITRHTVTGETGEQILAAIRELADSLDSPAQFDLTIDPPFYPPWETDSNHPLVAQFSRAYEAETGVPPELDYNQGVADTNYFVADLGIPAIQFGPHGANYHQANEWVSVPSIGVATRVILRVAMDVLRGNGD